MKYPVDIEAGDAFVENLKKKAPAIGGFNGAFKIPDFEDYEEPVLVSGADGVGTKIKVLTKIGPIKLYDYMTFTKWEEKKIIGVDHIGIVTGKGEMEFNKIDDNTTKFKWTETLKFPFPSLI